jgi:hypothetical protein
MTSKKGRAFDDYNEDDSPSEEEVSSEEEPA